MKRLILFINLIWILNLIAQQTPPVKIDGVAAVVGSEAILRSDIANMRLQMKEQNLLSPDTDDCQLLEMILQEKLLVNEAKEDTLITQNINKNDLREQAEQQLKYIKMQAGGLEQVLQLYHKNSEEELLNEITDFNYNRSLYDAMKNKITEKVEITPDEVKKFFENIPENKRPEFTTQVKLEQIVIKPEPDSTEVKNVINRLNTIREAILKGEKSFRAQAILYSQDPGTRTSGGLMTIDKTTPLVQSFKEIAFSLNEGEISKPFKTEYGWHIILVEKIKGRKRDIRHILLIPNISTKNINEAKQKLEKIKQRILDGELSFEEAAKEFSDDEESANRGGLIIDPATGESLMEVTKLPPNIYGQLIGRNEGDLTDIITDRTPTGQTRFILIKIKKKIPPHKADFVKDYPKIYQMALEKKKEKAIRSWIQEHLKNVYIYISDDYKKCHFKNNWLKKSA